MRLELVVSVGSGRTSLCGSLKNFCLLSSLLVFKVVTVWEGSSHRSKPFWSQVQYRSLKILLLDETTREFRFESSKQELDLSPSRDRSWTHSLVRCLQCAYPWCVASPFLPQWHLRARKLKDPPSLCSEERVPLDVVRIVIAHVRQWGLMGTVRAVIHLIHFGSWACAGKKNSYPWLLGNSLWTNQPTSTFKACENKFYFWQDVKKKITSTESDDWGFKILTSRSCHMFEHSPRD